MSSCWFRYGVLNFRRAYGNIAFSSVIINITEQHTRGVQRSLSSYTIRSTKCNNKHFDFRAITAQSNFKYDGYNQRTAALHTTGFAERSIDRMSSSETGRLYEDVGPSGRRRVLYEYMGRLYDVTRYFSLHPIVPETPAETRSQLKVNEVDLRITDNRAAHRTDRYEVSELILRRGQEFKIGLTLNRPYNKDKDVICVELRTGTHPLTSKRTLVLAKPVDKFEPKQWGLRVESARRNNVTLSVKSAANSIVGEYQLDILTHVIKDGTKQDEFRKGLGATVYLFFNAWCKDDQVYMEKSAERDEYVLNDLGNLWYGTSRYLGNMHWNFGQFDEVVFKCVMYLLKEHINAEHRGNPVVVSRVMSAAVNVQDDGGVLAGRWDGSYEDGARPTSWQGSVEILQKYFETKEAVKYGQCWVFSGVLTTVLRCLGMPTRSVTNFSSAHDTDRSVTIDECVDENDDMIDELNSDSVWNFHVWNDTWMARPDLPLGYGGWQAVDATPQETSEGVFQTGPCSLNAIKQGETYLPYDAPFVFAEVNADRVYWRCTRRYGDWDMQKIRTTKTSIGKSISTKAVGSSWRHDVTDQYKYPEGSNEERAAVRRAITYGDRPEIVEDDVMSDDVKVELVNKDVLMLGNDFAVEVDLVNTATVARNVNLTINAQVCYYTGVRAARIKKETQSISLAAGGRKTAKFGVSVAEYLEKLVEQSQFKVFLLGKVQETNQLIADQDDFRLETPDLALKVAPGSVARVGRGFKVLMSFTNPLSKPLTGCVFMTEGPGLVRPLREKFRDIAAGEGVHHEVTFSPLKAGPRVILAEFDCDQFQNVLGRLEVRVA